MQSPRMCPVSTRKIQRKLANLPKIPTDPFSSLPVELLEAIAVYLPTSDVLRLRLTTRAMTPIFTSKVFWKSRFSINGERGFLRPVINQEIEGNDAKEVDWRHLYHCTCKLKCSQEFEYQIRIWESLRWLRDATLARYSGKHRQKDSAGFVPCGLPLDFRGRALQGYHNSFYPNTRRESVRLDRSLERIIVSVREIDGTVNITGIEFVFSDMPNALIGYKTPGAATIESYAIDSVSRSIYTYPGIRFTTEISSLRGFSTESTPGGVHILTIFEEDLEYCVGESAMNTNTEHYECDLRLDEIMEVIGTFDVSSGSSLWTIGLHSNRS